jgi:hypothetical protein
MPSKYRKDVKGDHNVASELASHNQVIVDFGAGGMIAVCFVLLLVSAALIWLVVAHAALVTLVVIVLFVLFVLGAIAVGALYVARQFSETRAQLAEDKHRELWSQTVYAVGDGHIVVRNPATRELSVHSVRDVQEVRHFNDRPQLTEVAESLDSGMPPATDLMR